jgi:hypothetical protein
VLTGGDGRVCDTPQRTSIAAADGEALADPVFGGRNAEDQLMTSPQTMTNRLSTSESTIKRRTGDTWLGIRHPGP